MSNKTFKKDSIEESETLQHIHEETTSETTECLTDMTLTCKDCGCDFVFTVGEQQFYEDKGFTEYPKRCPDCRKAHKAAWKDHKSNSATDAK